MAVHHVSHYLIRALDQIEAAADAAAEADRQQLEQKKAEAARALAELEARKTR